MKDGIDWSQLGSGGRFEKVVSTLLSTLHPDSERIDGSGGDGGRDHQLRTDGHLDVWQSKYFLKRLSESASRKRQITDSLEAAAALQPDSWTLVTPMVPNPTERAWFEELAHGCLFPISWKGGDWLDANLARFPAIVRHFRGPEEEYVALLRELQDEQEALVDGLPAAQPRIERLAAKINDSNPFYRVDFTVQDGQIVSTQLVPKYRDADKDSPVMMKFTVVAGPAQDDLIDRLRAAIEWGDQVELPASHLLNVEITGPPGFGGVLDQAEIIIGPAPHEPIDLHGRMIIRSPSGQHLAALPARWLTRVAGTRGVTIRGKDLSGVIEVHLRVDPEKKWFTLNVTCTWSHPMLPGAVLPIVRWQQHAAPPNTLSVIVGDLTTTPVTVPSSIAVPLEAVQFVEDLDRLQTAVGEYFPVPQKWTAGDLSQVSRAVQLLDGHRIAAGHRSVILDANNPQGIRDAFRNAPNTLRMSNHEPYIAHVAGHDLELGPYTVYVPDAQLHPIPSVEDVHKFEILPGPGSQVEIALGGLPDGNEGLAEPS